MNLQGAFGMPEMDGAAERIVVICAPKWEQPISIEDMKKFDSDLIGFTELIANSWLLHDPSKGPGCFYPTEAFIERVEAYTSRIEFDGYRAAEEDCIYVRVCWYTDAEHTRRGVCVKVPVSLIEVVPEGAPYPCYTGTDWKKEVGNGS